MENKENTENTENNPAADRWEPRTDYQAVWAPFRPPAYRHSAREIILAGTLFLLTVASTTLVMGPAYSFAIMSILTTHEMGHYLMCRRYRVRSTLPILIPMPVVSPFGTMGAVIFMRALNRDRKSLFDIGIAGPLAGLVPALIATFWGLAHSTVTVVPRTGLVGVRLGDSLLLLLLEKLFYPSLGPHQELVLHPVAYAGWAGLFLTALNLLPIGQLDGGHVVYGLLGKRSAMVSWAFLAGLALLAVFHPEWWLLVGILLFVIGARHRAAVDESEPLDRRRILLGILTMVIFVLIFIPTPFRFP